MILRASGIDKSFDGNHVVKDVSLELVPSTVNLLMGANGSGKTTLINCISSLFLQDKGSVFFLGSDITYKRPDEIFQKQIIRTFQTPKLFENLTVVENLMMASTSIGEKFRHALFYNKWSDQEAQDTKRALSILDSLGLLHLRNNLAYELSGGQIKLLELAKILMSSPKLVLLDEPVAGVHPNLAEKIFSKITEICKTDAHAYALARW